MNTPTVFMVYPPTGDTLQTFSPDADDAARPLDGGADRTDYLVKLDSQHDCARHQLYRRGQIT